ncbi:GNAT family N-acetyltransferase [Azoarcus indigens]|nr:GNAT family N-acetyltransferase [Azoarcus indigens]NMG66982.1 GNAT family N-acetyltransferase [Azoarcus indigens]
MPAPAAYTLRDAQDADLPQIAALYGHYVLNSAATFEEAPPDAAAMAGRRAAVLDQGLPWLVAEEAGSILGYCYAAPYRPRAAYRYTLEDSIYIAQQAVGRGIGRALLGELIARCERGPWHQMVAVIGDSANAGSIALHTRLGFRHAGTLQAVGYKFGRWVDTVQMQRTLGKGEAGGGQAQA